MTLAAEAATGSCHGRARAACIKDQPQNTCRVGIVWRLRLLLNWWKSLAPWILRKMPYELLQRPMLHFVWIMNSIAIVPSLLAYYTSSKAAQYQYHFSGVSHGKIHAWAITLNTILWLPSVIRPCGIEYGWLLVTPSMTTICILQLMLVCCTFRLYTAVSVRKEWYRHLVVWCRSWHRNSHMDQCLSARLHGIVIFYHIYK